MRLELYVGLIINPCKYKNKISIIMILKFNLNVISGLQLKQV